ncbi:MAG: hypothetical protein H0X38_05655 [Planctomycetes bacterium]|nr:hypothetical protein [Planctomycetota bacterium]
MSSAAPILSERPPLYRNGKLVRLGHRVQFMPIPEGRRAQFRDDVLAIAAAERAYRAGGGK